MMDDREKSDGRVLPEKLSNNAQGGRRRRWREGDQPRGTDRRNAPRTQCRARRAQWAWSCAPSGADGQGSAVHRALHHVDVDRLGWRLALRPKAAPGVDGVTWADYGVDSKTTFGIFMLGSTGARTGRGRRGGCTYRSPTGGCGRSVSCAGRQDPAAGGGGGTERHL